MTGKAARFNIPEVVELLLHAAADPTIRTKNRRFNAADVAKADNPKVARHPVMARLNGITAQAPHRVGQCLALP